LTFVGLSLYFRSYASPPYGAQSSGWWFGWPFFGFAWILIPLFFFGVFFALRWSWDFGFSGVPGFAQQYVRSQLERGTREALARIAAAAEGDGRAPASPARGERRRPK